MSKKMLAPLLLELDLLGVNCTKSKFTNKLISNEPNVVTVIEELVNKMK
jgi:hypothetical protein